MQFVYHASFYLKLIYANLCTLSYSQSFRAAKTSLEIQPEFIRAQHLHVITRHRQTVSFKHCETFRWCFCFGCNGRSVFHGSSCCLFMETNLLVLLQDTCLDLLRCAFLRKLSGCVKNITAFCQHLLRPISRHRYIGKAVISDDISATTSLYECTYLV